MFTVKVKIVRGNENDERSLKKKKTKKRKMLPSCFTRFEKGRLCFYLGGIVCETLKQPLLNVNESGNVAPLVVNCVRTDCKIANAHKIVVATSLHTGFT